MVLIFYKNLKKHKKTTEKNITFSIFKDGVISNEDDLISKPNECKTFYNFTITDGALKTGLGFKDIEVPASESNLQTVHTYNMSTVGITEITAIDSFRYKHIEDDRYYYHINIVDQRGYLWICAVIDEIGYPIAKSNLGFSDLVSTSPYRINDYDCILYFVPSGMIYSSGYETEKYTNVPPLLSVAVHYDKFFGITDTNRNELIYQDNLDLTNYDGADNKFIEFVDQRGAFTKLVTFNDYIYLFREYGITRISEYSTSGNFSFTHLYTSTSKIYENSVSVCGDLVYFATRDGLYSFNGSSVRRICEDFDSYFKNLDNTHCSACSMDGKYYLATRYDFNDELSLGCENETGYINNVLFEVDIETNSVDILRGVDIKKIIALDVPYFSKVIACFNGANKAHLGELTHNGKIFTSSNQKFWTSFKTDLDFKGKMKRIKEIILNTEEDCEVIIESDLETKTYIFEGSEKEQRQLANVVGRNFQISFKSSSAESHISKPMIVFDVIS